MPTRVLFVCLGNICRSPTAEGVFRHLVQQEGVAERFHIDSAGTGDWHVGQPPDARMTAAAQRAGYALRSRARQVEAKDFESFDHIIAMDQENLKDLQAQCPETLRAKLRLLRSLEHDPADLDVPDPYYGGQKGFDEVIAIVERCARRLLEELKAP